MDKYSVLRGRNDSGAPFIHRVEPKSRYGMDESAGLEKTASGEHLPEVIELIESIEPQPGRLYLVNSALGAGEYVGFNLRGDWFTEAGLLNTPEGWDDIPVWDIEARRKAAARTKPVRGWGRLAWGYPTFYNAHKFRHHVNKDPNRAYGYVLGAFWDPRMHRVIIVSELIRSYCERLGALDLYQRIEAGDFPDTSMGARVPYDRCFPAHTFISTESGPRQIQDIKVGDRVYTLQGNLKTVTRLFRTEDFDGELVRIRSRARLPVDATSNHPYFRIPREQIRSCIGSVNGKKRRHSYDGGDTCTTCGRGRLSIEEVQADELRPDDVLVTPVISGGEGPEYGPALSYVAGVYAGDGCQIRQRRGKKKDGGYVLQGLQFSCGADDPHIDRLLSALSELSHNEPKVYDDGDKNAVSIRIYDQVLAAQISSMVQGRKAAHKTLVVPLDHQEDRLGFLGGLIDSDGCSDSKSSRISSTSPMLSRAAWELGVRCRLPVSISAQSSPRSSGFQGTTEERFTVYFPAASCSDQLAPFSAKVQPSTSKWKSSAGFFWTSEEGQLYYCSAITGVDLYESQTPVFNFSVEDDETYIAEGAAVHNCSICNHVARNPSEYCEHVRKFAAPPYGMKAILPDGRRCGVYNDYPRFFDDSYVFVGAERSAKVMDNVTSRIRGNRQYTNRIYAVRPPYAKVASTPNLDAQPPGDERMEQEAALGRAMEQVNKPHDGPSSRAVGIQLSKIMDLVPVINDRERTAMDHALGRIRREAQVQDGTLTKSELNLWQMQERIRLQGHGIDTTQTDRARALVHFYLQHAFGEEKNAAAFKPAQAKWAEHLKEIPAPSEHQRALIKDHEGRLSEIPKQVLDHVSLDVPTGLSALAQLGIVLRPHEYQYCVSPALGIPRSEGVFQSIPVDTSHAPRWRPTRVPLKSISTIRDMLGPALSGRSFAPRAVRIRITEIRPVSDAPSPPVMVSEGLNKIAQLYNDYRIGLVAHTPEWEDVLDHPVKVGSAAHSLSNYLLRLAYWPGLGIG